jgi:ATP-binding cassette subfamily B multidrug efflux pump
MLRWFENLLNPFPDKEISLPSPSLWRFVWACTKGSRLFILIMTGATAVLGGFEAFLFAVMGQVVDWLSKTSPELLWATEKQHLLLLVGLLLLSPIITIVQTLIKHQTLAGNFPMRMRWNFHRLMLSQSMSFYQDEFAGRVAAKVMQTALAVRDMWFIVADILVFVVIYFVTMVAVVGHFNTTVMLPFLVWVVSYVACLSYFVPRLAKVSQYQADARSLMTGRISDAYTNISTVKLFSHAGREANYAKSAMQEFLQTVHAQMRYVSGVEVTNHILNILLVMSTSGVAVWLWTKGEVTIGGVAAVTAMALRLNGISHWVMWELTSLYEQIGTAQDGVNTLSTAHEIKDTLNAKPLQVRAGRVQFEQVSFSYGMQKPVLQALNLDIAPGEKVGLVGRSGAGKSTIVNLLLRFYDVEQGRVLIDGQDVTQVTQNSLRSQIGMVTQDTSLLHRSVRDNILYGQPNATEADMINAAKRAEAHDFIMALSDAKGRTGYDAHVGERGVKLSGGQRQRIAIARVMLKDAPILLLDEATSALDSEVEQAIQASLYSLMHGKTVVAIAHRLSTIAAMDRLVVLDAGKIIEQGSHQQLLQQGGLYASLWAHQSGGFLGE